VETETGSQQRRESAAQIYDERRYPQLDCVGTYVWIWERVRWVTGEARPVVVARRIERPAR
jgi:hypothetical protein